MSVVPAFARGLCDDAAMFPPGLAPLPDAVSTHARHKASAYADLVGPLVVAASALDDLRAILGGAGAGVGVDRLDLAVTVPSGPEKIAAALDGLPVDLCAVEVAVPAGMAAPVFFAALDRAIARLGSAEIFVEVPRDNRHTEIIAALASTCYKAKFRTGGVTAELYPDEAELAAAIRAVVDAGVPFKATAGLHHAIRNSDPDTGLEQHGFLNLLVAVDAALHGASQADLVGLLAERNGPTVAARLRDLGEDRIAAARARFMSFGTCSIHDPLTDLVDLGLLPASVTVTNREED